MPTKIVDSTFGKLKLIDQTAYFSEVSWNRDLVIRIFIHIEGQNYAETIENAKKTFLLVREKEEAIFEQGADLTSLGEYADNFLNSAHETSIEIYPNGSGTLVYLVMMIGTIIIGFTSNGSFENAQIVSG